MPKQDINPKARGTPRPAGLHWFEVHFPHSLTPDDVVRALQPLAYRPQLGWRRKTPVVVFELRAHADSIRWLVGVDPRISNELPAQLQAQLPGLVLSPELKSSRPLPALASSVRPSSLTQPLRVEMGAAVTAGLLEVLNGLSKRESAVVQWVIGPTQQRRVRPAALSVPRALGLVPASQETADDKRQWRKKAAEPLLAVRGRIAARSANHEAASAIVRTLGEALHLVSAHQADLQIARPTVRTVRQLDHITNAQWSGVLNVAELAAVVGWPVEGTGSLHAPRGRQYPAPTELLVPVGAKVPASERVLGAGLHPSQPDQLVTLPTESALHHLHVVGPTGSGKSTLLGQLITADMQAGKSVLVIEPRGDLVEDVLQRVPPARREDIVVIEPGQGDEVVGFNPLRGRQEDAEQRADTLLHLFHELYGRSIGPRSSDVLLHAFIALARSDHGTLADVPVLLTNAAFRRRTLAAVSDPLVIAPFFAWYDALSEAERQQVVAPVLNKTRAFLTRTPIRRLIGQAAPRFDMNELFQRPRIVLVNLNVGVIGEETADLIGALLVTQFYGAMQRQAMIPATKRRPVMAVIDEVQNYLRLPVDLGDMFAQARGLGVGLTVAHQHLGQLPPKMKAGLLANARNRVVFRPSVEDGAPLAAVLGGDLSAQDLALLQAHEAYAQVLVTHAPRRPFLVRTLLPPTRALSSSPDLRRDSAARFGVDGQALDNELRKRWQGRSSTPDAPIGQVPRGQA
ncbi:type IV secretory system conjugative DNA transfer family protein [Streptomyces sp. NPDC056835]|uniref:type IV secretory system conjugative DNA transfer family protein n=1 Tax=Streptomyces sp. NPDC056835 TaxID=3345956 RepID=UPI0036C6AF5D